METRGHLPVIVVGGGLSGLAASVELSAAGIPVLLLEQKPAPGGRACSYVDAVTGDEIDNGQHLLIAGYTHTLAFLETIGSRHLVDVQKHPLLPYHHPTRGFVEFRLPALPSPLHLLWGILRTPLLSFPDRWALVRAGAALRAGNAEAERGATIAAWLDAQRQPAEVRRCFWEPLAIAIMNERIDRAPAQLFLDALRQAFLRESHDAALVFPRVGLSRLFADPARAFIERRGGEVRCKADVVRVAVSGGCATGVLLKDGTLLPCAGAILTVPPAHLLRLIPEGTVNLSGVMAENGSSPIISIHLWMELPQMRHEAVGLIGRRVQWVFRRKHHLALVISAAHAFLTMDNRELTAIAMEDLRAVFGDSPGEPSRSVVIREKNGTVSFTPENEHARPGAATGISNLWLGGDWTDTGLPATIEGAIVSGRRAARLAGAGLHFRGEMGILKGSGERVQ